LLEGRGRLAYLHSATGTGATKASACLKEVLANPLGDYGILGADRIMFNITGDKNLKMHEVSEISRTIAAGNPRAKIIFGIAFQPEFKDKARITLFAVGCKEGQARERQKPLAKRKYSKPKAKAQGKLPLLSPKKKAQPAAKEELAKAPAAPPGVLTQDSSKMRRNALDLKKAVEEEIQELEKKEKAWDIPSFLRNKPAP
jgi:hypothetical protein